MSHQCDDTERRGLLRWVACILLIAFVLYPLSFGPVQGLVYYYGLNLPHPVGYLTEIVYAPLGVLSCVGGLPEWYRNYLIWCWPSGRTP